MSKLFAKFKKWLINRSSKISYKVDKDYFNDYLMKFEENNKVNEYAENNENNGSYIKQYIKHYDLLKKRLEEFDDLQLNKLNKSLKNEIESLKHISKVLPFETAFYAILVSLITKMFTGGYLFVYLIIFAVAFLFEIVDLKKDSKNIEYNLLTIDIIDEILQERQKAESANENNNIDTKKHINTKQ